MTEIHDRESALSRDLAGLNCALVKIVDADDRYYVLVGEPELYRDGFRLETSGLVPPGNREVDRRRGRAVSDQRTPVPTQEGNDRVRRLNDVANNALCMAAAARRSAPSRFQAATPRR